MKFIFCLFILYPISSFAMASNACIKILDPINARINSALVDIEHSDLNTLIETEHHEKAFKRLNELESEIRNGSSNKPKTILTRVRLLQALLIFRAYNNDPFILAEAIDIITKIPVPLRRGPVVNWHLAEMYYKNGQILSAIRTLNYIKTTNSQPSFKISKYLAHLNTLIEKPEPVDSHNVQLLKPLKTLSKFSSKELDSLDKENWGPYNPL